MAKSASLECLEACTTTPLPPPRSAVHGMEAGLTSCRGAPQCPWLSREG